MLVGHGVVGGQAYGQVISDQVTTGIAGVGDGNAVESQGARHERRGHVTASGTGFLAGLIHTDIGFARQS